MTIGMHETENDTLRREESRREPADQPLDPAARRVFCRCIVSHTIRSNPKIRMDQIRANEIGGLDRPR